MRTATIRTYKGHTIHPCERPAGEHPGRWFVQTFHKTGMPYTDELHRHFATLADAKASINEQIEHDAIIGS